MEKQEQKNQQQELKLDKQEQKLEKQEQKNQQQELKLDKQEQKLEKQEQKNQQQELKLDKQEQKLEKQEQKNQQQELKLDKQEQKLEKQKQKNKQGKLKLKNTREKFEQVIKLQEKKIEEMEQKFEHLLKESDQNEVALDRTFKMKNFSKEKAKDKMSDWKSPAMYTHVGVYKFCIGIDANGYGSRRGKALYVDLWAMPGEYDHQLKWPVEATLTIELLHQQGGRNVQHTTTRRRWWEPDGPYNKLVGGFGDIEYGLWPHFVLHSRLSGFLRNDTLYFRITKITI